jgi:hypothetical protein
MAARMKMALFGIVVVSLIALPACAQAPQPLPPCSGESGGPPNCTPPMPHPDAQAQQTCPETADCMPGPDNARAERCAWIKANCPNTKIAY